MLVPLTSTVASRGPESSTMSPEASCSRACARAASTSSWETSASASRAMVPPTGTSTMVSTTSARTVPVQVDSRAPAILSVSISQMSWPSVSSSPSATNQSVTLPDSMDRPHLGMVIRWMRSVTWLGALSSVVVMASAAPVGHGLDGVDDVLRLRDVQLLQRTGERHRHMRRADHLDRCLQVAERLGAHLGADVGGHVAPRTGLVDDDQPAGLLHRFQDGVQVQRAGRPRIDDLRLDAGGLQFGGRLDGLADHPAHRDDGDVVALADHVGLAERNGVTLLRNRAGHVVHGLVLQENDRVIVPDRLDEKAFHLVRAGRQ